MFIDIQYYIIDITDIYWYLLMSIEINVNYLMISILYIPMIIHMGTAELELPLLSLYFDSDLWLLN